MLREEFSAVCPAAACQDLHLALEAAHPPERILISPSILLKL